MRFFNKPLFVMFFLFFCLLSSFRAYVGIPDKILYFGAVWCSPCERFKVEVLHNPEYESYLRPFRVIYIDVDKEENQLIAAKYQIENYPMFIAIDANGTELSRMMGYGDPEDALIWFETLSSTLLSPEQASPSQSAEIARWLASIGSSSDQIEPYLRRAKKGTARTWAKMIVFDQKGKTKKACSRAKWMLRHAEADDWIWTALSLYPKGYRKLDSEARFSTLPPIRKALFLYTMGSKAKELKHDKDATFLFDKGINILAESADHCADQRSECELLAALYFVQGDLFSADMTWRKLVNIFPNECTFYVELMELWHEFSKTVDLSLEESQQKSLAWGELAASKAYGAQTLSVALKRANILVDMGKIEEAKKILVKALASVPAPDASHGKTRIEYKREQIEKLLKKLDS